MSARKFKELVKLRKDWVRSSKENNFDFDSILSGLYNKPSHFIYEILQNAEDAGATSITFNLFNDRLETIHNASKDFDFDDVDGITGIGISTKKDDLNKIGKFGVGFKSVFAITKSPIIKSGNFHFQINDFVIPSSNELNGSKGTTIVLPFNHPTRKKNEVFNLVENKLQDIGLKTLLFLSNIKEIIWITPSHNGHYYKSNKMVNNNSKIKKISIISVTDNVEYFEEYLVFYKPINLVSKKLKVEIAYKLKSDENEVEKIVSVPDQESKLVVYFPTEKITYLNFIIQGPFKTTPNRENIPLDDKQNETIINEIACLVADSLPIIKKLKYLTTSFLEVLPINNENCDESIYLAIFNSVKEKFLSEEKLLLTNHGGYSHPNDSILARGKVLTKLLKSNDISTLFQKSHWLNTSITYDRTRELRDYLINELGIEEINFEDFCENITEKFMKSKNDDWIVKFYGELSNSNRDTLFRKETRWNIEGALFRKPIVRLKNNKHCSLYDKNGKIQVYLPTKTKSSYKIVKASIAKRKRATAFFKKRDVTEPDIFAEINEYILPKYQNVNMDINDDEYFEDIEKILTAISKKNYSDKINELFDNLKELRIIDAFNPETNENYLMQPSQIYINSDNIRFYFEGYENAYFINKKMYNKFGENRINEFVLKVDCNRYPKRIEFEGNLSWEEKRKLRNNSNVTFERYTKDYYLDGLENLLEKVNLEKSILLWEVLLKSLSEFDKFDKERFFMGQYSWFYYSEQLEYYNSNFKVQLCSEKWLFDKCNNQVRASEILISELADNYNTENENIDVLEKVLGFKLDKIQQIEEETGGIFLTAEEKQEYEKLLAEKKAKEEEKEDEKWKENVSPEELDPVISEGTLEPSDVGDLTGQGNDNEDNEDYDDGGDGNDGGDDDDTKIPPILVGNWGERYVYNYFKKFRFDNLKDLQKTKLGFSGKDITNTIIEVKWLNKQKDSGKGYDFVIIENGIEVEYIEVKTTIKPDKTLHIITGTQWEFARNLFRSGDGEKYKIYAVKNANSYNARIKFISNPIKLWKEGKLYAHPINFKV